MSWFTVPVYFVVAWALYRRGLWRSYIYFFICIILEGLTLGMLLLAQDNNRAYVLIYKVSQVHTWVLYVMMVIELYRKVFARFPGIARFAQRVVIASVFIAFLVGLASIGGDLTQGWSGRSMIFRYSIILRAISAAITLFLLLIALFLVWLPIPLPANTIRHSLIFFFYFFVTAFVHYLLAKSSVSLVQVANLVTAVLTLAALLCWYWLLKPEGEIAPTAGKGPRTPSSEMIGRLEALNRTLSRPSQ